MQRLRLFFKVKKISNPTSLLMKFIDQSTRQTTEGSTFTQALTQGGEALFGSLNVNSHSFIMRRKYRFVLKISVDKFK